MAHGLLVRSPLLELPPEIRNTIYRLALTTNGEVRVGSPSNFQTRIALTQTCSAIGNETLDIFYAENDFELIIDGDHAHCLDWISRIAASGTTAQLLRSLTLRVGISIAGFIQIEQEFLQDAFRARQRGETTKKGVDGAGRGNTDAQILTDALAALLKAGLTVSSLHLKAPGTVWLQRWASLYNPALFSRVSEWMDGLS